MPQMPPGTIAMTSNSQNEFDEPIRNQLAMKPTMQPRWPKNPEQIYSEETIVYCAGGGREEAVLISYVKILQIIYIFYPASKNLATLPMKA